MQQEAILICEDPLALSANFSIFLRNPPPRVLLLAQGYNFLKTDR